MIPNCSTTGSRTFECVDSTVTKISEIVPKDGKRFQFTYEYDFGDGWQHEVLVRGMPPCRERWSVSRLC